MAQIIKPAAVLISAGIGSRLGKNFKHIPKCLLPLSPGVTLFDFQVKSLRRAGITRIYIVTGFMKEKIEPPARRLGVRTIFNPFFRCSGNIVSVWLGLLKVRGWIITINGDNIFRSSVIRKLLTKTTKEDITITVSRKTKFDSDDMKVLISGSRLMRVSKKLRTANAESIGIIRYSPQGRRHMIQAIEFLLRGGGKDKFYLAAIDHICREGRQKVGICECGPEDWAEVDYIDDYHSVLNAYLKGQFGKRL